MKCRSIVGTLFLFMMLAAVSRPAQAVETTFGAGATTNPSTGVPNDIREVVNVTLSSPDSTWYQSDFHADNSTTGNSYAIYYKSHDQSTSQDLFEFGNSTQSGGGGPYGMPNGTYNCWAIVRGYTMPPNQSPTPWSSGVTAKTVTITII